MHFDLAMQSFDPIDNFVLILWIFCRTQDYKTTLLQLERVYGILLDLESLKLKLAAIPTGAPLREQVRLRP